jgi:hypothetical protein
MIQCILDGGLGNMMFEIATLESMSEDTGLKTNYPNFIEHFKDLTKFERTQTYNPFEYLDIFKNFTWFGRPDPYLNFRDIPYAYFDLQPKDGDCFKGYFQSEKYFKHNWEFILTLFEPSDKIKTELLRYDRLTNQTTCSIHVRRGDYLKYKDIHFVQDMEYFNKAIKTVGKVDQYLIFSDDIPWCKENFKGDKFYFVENEKDYIELFLMSKCTHNIISNSSFSWWGAWLSSNKNKIVIAPEKWWIGESKDVIPETWIKL